MDLVGHHIFQREILSSFMSHPKSTLQTFAEVEIEEEEVISKTDMTATIKIIVSIIMRIEEAMQTAVDTKDKIEEVDTKEATIEVVTEEIEDMDKTQVTKEHLETINSISKIKMTTLIKVEMSFKVISKDKKTVCL